MFFLWFSFGDYMYGFYYILLVRVVIGLFKGKGYRLFFKLKGF